MKTKGMIRKRREHVYPQMSCSHKTQVKTAGRCHSGIDKTGENEIGQWAKMNSHCHFFGSLGSFLDVSSLNVFQRVKGNLIFPLEVWGFLVEKVNSVVGNPTKQRAAAHPQEGRAGASPQCPAPREEWAPQTAPRTRVHSHLSTFSSFKRYSFLPFVKKKTKLVDKTVGKAESAACPFDVLSDLIE